MSVTVRIPAATHEIVRRLASDHERPITDVIADAVALYDEAKWWDEVDASYARLRDDPVASAEFDAEMALLDGALMDGLAEWPYEGIEELEALKGKGGE